MEKGWGYNLGKELNMKDIFEKLGITSDEIKVKKPSQKELKERVTFLLKEVARGFGDWKVEELLALLIAPKK